MATLTIRPGNPLRGTTSIPGDKSLSHRALMLGAIAKGETQIRGWLPAGDTLATLDSVQRLGVSVIQHDATTLTVGGGGFHAPKKPLDFVNAGTGIRLMAGLLAGQNFESELDGSAQLRRRPMRRITDPLRQMNANITDTDGCAPLTIRPSQLKGIHYEQKVASAQVKSALLLAGLYANSPTVVVESAGPGRDHTERMLKVMGVPLTVEGEYITIMPFTDLSPLDLTIPGDFSSAAFLIVAGTLVRDSEILLTGVNTNDRRTGLLEVLERMQVDMELQNHRFEGGEPVADILITTQETSATTVHGSEVVRMIDEFPILMVLATQSAGETRVREAKELRVKETDRISVMAGELRKMGADIIEYPDGFAVKGPQRLNGAVVDSHDDHRVGMSLAVAGLVADGETIIEDAGCIHDSFPGFETVLERLGVELEWKT
jgi:3-phosphoshikimate 1-carboxyvinyltransferase